MFGELGDSNIAVSDARSRYGCHSKQYTDSTIFTGPKQPRKALESVLIYKEGDTQEHVIPGVPEENHLGSCSSSRK